MVFDTQCLPPERFELRSGLGFEFVELLPLFALPPSRVKDSQILPAPWCEHFHGSPKDFKITSDFKIRSFDPRVLPQIQSFRKAPRISLKVL